MLPGKTAAGTDGMALTNRLFSITVARTTEGRLKCLQFTGIAAIALPRNAPHSLTLTLTVALPSSLSLSLHSTPHHVVNRSAAAAAISHVRQKSEQIGPGLDRPNPNAHCPPQSQGTRASALEMTYFPILCWFNP